MSPEIRFWRYVNKSDDGCWRWTGGLCYGYGIFRIRRGVSARAHRFSYEMHRGPIADGLQVCHRCDVRCCVNPAHLFLGTSFDNMRDASAKGRIASGDRNASRLHPDRVPRGERNGWAKINADIVIAIRRARASGATFDVLARQFPLSRSRIFNIVHRKQWAHIPEVRDTLCAQVS